MYGHINMEQVYVQQRLPKLPKPPQGRVLPHASWSRPSSSLRTAPVRRVSVYSGANLRPALTRRSACICHCWQSISLNSLLHAEAPFCTRPKPIHQHTNTGQLGKWTKQQSWWAGVLIDASHLWHVREGQTAHLACAWPCNRSRKC